MEEELSSTVAIPFIWLEVTGMGWESKKIPASLESYIKGRTDAPAGEFSITSA